jgi:hypothetical protein
MARLAFLCILSRVEEAVRSDLMAVVRLVILEVLSSGRMVRRVLRKWVSWLVALDMRQFGGKCSPTIEAGSTLMLYAPQLSR